MELTDKERTRVVEAFKKGLPDFPDGPIIETFDMRALADALEQQATRAKILYDFPKVDLRMDADDAIKLARLLRDHVTR